MIFDLAVLTPYLVSVAITLLYALLSYDSSGEPFDKTKFATTMGVQLSALLVAFFADVPALAVLFAPSLIALFVGKVVSWIQKKRGK